MSLLPDRHPQKDFFILDISDVVPKDDTASMAHPIFSLTTKPDFRQLEYQGGNHRLTISPSYYGLPNIFDKDVLIFCMSQLMHLKNQGKPIGPRVRFAAREMLIATNRKTGGAEYKRLERAFQRLVGTTFQTDIRTGGKVETKVFSLVQEAGFVRKEGSWRVDYCEVVLSDWLMRAIEAAEVVTISPDYFRLRQPQERRLYEIARKHCGSQAKWQIKLTHLQAKTGSTSPLNKFRLKLRQTIKDDSIPSYQFELLPDDLVVVRPKSRTPPLGASIVIPDWAEEQAREICSLKGWDYQALRARWLEYAEMQSAQNNPPRNVGAAFVAFCKKQPALRI